MSPDLSTIGEILASDAPTKVKEPKQKEKKKKSKEEVAGRLSADQNGDGDAPKKLKKKKKKDRQPEAGENLEEATPKKTKKKKKHREAAVEENEVSGSQKDTPLAKKSKKKKKTESNKRQSGEKSEEGSKKKRRKSLQSSKQEETETSKENEGKNPENGKEKKRPLVEEAVRLQAPKTKKKAKLSSDSGPMHSPSDRSEEETLVENRKVNLPESEIPAFEVGSSHHGGENVKWRNQMKEMWRQDRNPTPIELAEKEEIREKFEEKYGGETHCVNTSDVYAKGVWRAWDPESLALFRNGPFSYREDQKIEEYFEEYAVGKGLDMKDVEIWAFPHRRFRKGTGNRVGMELWFELSRAMNRTPVALYLRGQRLFLRRNCKTGKWSNEDTKQLVDLYKTHGPKWLKIGQELQRLDRDVRAKYHSITEGGGLRGPWTEEEVELLKKSVNKYWNETECDVTMTKVHNLPWGKISAEVETRNPQHCMRFWYDHLSPSMVAKGEWALEDDHTLMEAMWKSGGRFEYELAWHNLVPHREEKKARLRWVMLRKEVPGRHDLFMREVIEYICVRDLPDLWEELEDYDGAIPHYLNPLYRSLRSAKKSR